MLTLSSQLRQQNSRLQQDIDGTQRNAALLQSLRTLENANADLGRALQATQARNTQLEQRLQTVFAITHLLGMNNA